MYVNWPRAHCCVNVLKLDVCNDMGTAIAKIRVAVHGRRSVSPLKLYLLWQLAEGERVLPPLIRGKLNRQL